MSATTGSPMDSFVIGGTQEQANSLVAKLQKEYEAAFARYVELYYVNPDGDDTKEAEVLANAADQKLKHMSSMVSSYKSHSTAEAVPPVNSVPPSSRVIVPSGLPLLQLKGEVIWEKEAKAYDSAHDFCQKFETVLRAHALNLDSEWERLLPMCLNTEQVSWFQEELQDGLLNWEEARTKITDAFDTPFRKFLLMAEVSRMEQGEYEPVREYTYRYQKLRREAGIPDDTQLAVNYFVSLRQDVQARAQVAIAGQMGNSLPTSINQIIDLVYAVAVDKVPNKSHKRLRTSDSRSHNSMYKRDTVPPSSSKAYSITSISKTNKQPGNLCSYCKKVVWVKGHRCDEYKLYHNKEKKPVAADNNKSFFNGNKVSSMALRSARIKQTQETKNKKDIMDPLLEIDEMALGNNENIIVKRDFKNINFNISVPLTLIQNNSMKPNLKVLAILDTGANFSAVDKNFCIKNKLVYKPFDNINNSCEYIEMASDACKVERIGTTTLSFKCKEKTYKHTFEVMNLSFNSKISIGLDLMSKLGIGIYGLPTTFDEVKQKPNDNIEIGRDLIPNECPAGTEVEHKEFLGHIQPFIDQNMSIQPGSFCTIPESVITIDTPDGVTSYRRQYPLPESCKQAIRETVDKWVKEGTIVRAPANTSWNSALTVVSKRNSKGEITGYRVCLDPRHINKLALNSSCDRFPIPLIKDIFQRLKGATIFSTLDLKSCFHMFKVREDHQHKTAFTVDNVQYMFQGCPFGLSSISSRAQRTMSIVFRDMQGFVTTFVDDIVVFSKGSLHEHEECLKKVIQRLTEVNLKINPDKCHFGQKSVYLLGFCVNENGISIDTRKVANIHDWPQPRTGKDIQRYLGLVNFFRDFVPNISKMTAPLDALRNVDDLSKIWTDKHQSCFVQLKKVFLHKLVLRYPVMNEPFYVATDASNVGIGAVLYQVINNEKRYISFLARSLTKSERSYSTTKRELLAVVFALKRFHQYLWGNHFILFTDHRALTYLHTQKIANAMMINWLDTIIEYNFDIVHLPGVDNVLPDALSRLFSVVDELGEDKAMAYKENKSGTMINRAMTRSKKVESSSIRDWSDIEQNTFMTPPEEDRKALLEETHLFGHFGSDAIYKSLRRKGIYWKNLKNEAIELVKQCNECQKFNIVKKGYNPLRPISSSVPGDHWAIDLAGPFITSRRNNRFLLVMVDICTRYCVLRPIPDKQASTIAQELINVFCEYGLPKVLQSDNGGEFVNELMQIFAEEAGFEHRLISSYHPRANGVSEKWVHKSTLAIKKRVEGANADWDVFVPSTQLALNALESPRTKTPPFTLMFGREMNDFKNYKNEDIKEPLSNQELVARIKHMADIVFPAIKERTEIAMNTQKEKFNTSHNIKEFTSGTHVMVLIPEKSSKLQPYYEGPYTVIRKNQGGAYILKDENEKEIEKRFPPSALKLVKRKSEERNETEGIYIVQTILEHKKHKGNYLYKVRWKGYDGSHDTWEPAAHFTDPKLITEYWQRIGIIPETLNKRKKKTSLSNNRTPSYKKRRL